MKCVTPVQMRSIDDAAINRLKIPGIVLMENAALAVVEEILKVLGDVGGKNIAVFAGKGNNGGDAFVVARHLHVMGANIIINILTCRNEIKGDARVNLDAVDAIGIKTVEIVGHVSLDELMASLFVSDLVVDGIYGTGFKGAVNGIPGEIIDIINHSGKYIISIDIPSGVDGESGKASGMSIIADKTVTFVLPKVGLLINDGVEKAGEIVVRNIGIPDRLIHDVVFNAGIRYNFTDEHDVSGFFSPRRADTNKGDYGRVFIVSGSAGMSGAGKLASMAAFRCGSGLVYLGVPASLTAAYAAGLTEPVVIPLEDKGTGWLHHEYIETILEQASKCDVLLVGPGMSQKDETGILVKGLIERCKLPMVLDADALNLIAGDVGILGKLQAPAVITPHPGEMARLTGMPVSEVQNDRIAVAAEFARKRHVIVVLKGHRTIIAGPDGDVYINPTGGPGMATAGSGDVLAGIIASLIGQIVGRRQNESGFRQLQSGYKSEDGLSAHANVQADCKDVLRAAYIGVHLHGLAGDMAASYKGEYGMIAGDIVEQIPVAIKKITQSRNNVDRYYQYSKNIKLLNVE